MRCEPSLRVPRVAGRERVPPSSSVVRRLALGPSLWFRLHASVPPLKQPFAGIMPDSLNGTRRKGKFARDLFIGEAEEVFHFDHRAPVRVLARKLVQQFAD